MSANVGLGLAPGQLPPFVELKDKSVLVKSLDSRLVRALVVLGHVHTFLFDKVLVITSGDDGTHAPGSKHYKGKACDVRSKDKTPAERVLFASILAQQVERLGVSFFLEHAGTEHEHFHLEVEG